ncbi:MAG: hypothetical protein IKF14_02230 [Atopobiaceae bacterium]|nr:hypothetical protein [Atopobiaceae bacterium]
MMEEVPLGTIDPWKLGCPPRACAVFAEHASGRTVQEIADDFRMTEDAVRGEIAGVWHDDKAAYATRRRIRDAE